MAFFHLIPFWFGKVFVVVATTQTNTSRLVKKSSNET